MSWDGEAGRVIAYKVGGGGDECLALRKNVKNVKELVVPPIFTFQNPVGREVVRNWGLVTYMPQVYHSKSYLCLWRQAP